MEKPQIYRDMIDDLVRMCKEGQGQIGSNRVRVGVWNANATATFIPEQHAINLLLSRLSQADRDLIADLLSDTVSQGVFETLKVLEQFEIPPFEDGYEGSPFNDFLGRMDDWEWPE